MTLGEQLDVLEWRVGETLTTNVSTDPRFFTKVEVIEWLDIYRKDFARRTRILYLSQSIDSVADQREYTINSKFINLVRVEYNKNKLSHITKEDLDLIYKDWQIADAGTPRYYYREGFLVIGLHPKPDVAGTGYIVVEGEQLPTTWTIATADTTASDFQSDDIDMIILDAVTGEMKFKRGKTAEAQFWFASYERKIVGFIAQYHHHRSDEFRQMSDMYYKSRTLYRQNF